MTCRSGWTDASSAVMRAGVDELLDDGVVDAHLLEPALDDAVDPGVAEVGQQPLGDAVVDDEDRHHGGRAGVPAGLHGPVGVAVVDDARLRAGEGVGDELGPAARVVGLGEALELLDHHLARDVAAGVAAHAVGDDEDGRRHEVGVLVDLAHQPDVRRRPVVQINVKHVGPLRPVSRCGAAVPARRVA